MPSSHIRLTTLTVEPGASWNTDCYFAAIPTAWTDELKQEYLRRSHVGAGWSLPTTSLADLLLGLDPALSYVGTDLSNPLTIVGLSEPDRAVVAAALATWATTEVADTGCDIDWWQRFQSSQIGIEQMPLNLLEFGLHTNGTAAGSKQMFKILPSLLAAEVVKHGLTLLGRHRQFIAGPPEDNARSAVLWPPVRLDDPRAGAGLVTAKITFHVETVPTIGRPQIHADLSLSRFPLSPVTYVPGRGAGAPSVTVWLHAPEGFLHPTEPKTLLAGTAQQVWTGGNRRWAWKPGLATALSRLTHLPFPSPEKVFGDPAAATDEGAIRAFILYSGGTKSRAADLDDLEIALGKAGSGPQQKAKSLLHPANTGFVPDDHIAIHSELTALLAPYGIVANADLAEAKAGSRRLLKLAPPKDVNYTIEVWTQSEVTKQAILAAAEHALKLQRSDTSDPDIARFTSEIDLTFQFRDAGTLGAPVHRPPDNKQPESTLLGSHANQVTKHLGTAPGLRAAILELNDESHFRRMQAIDPKPALKKGFARSGRVLQCIQPAKAFVEPAQPPAEGNKPRKQPYPGTTYAAESIHRASAAILDALRQLGRLGSVEMPYGLPVMEQIGIWLHHDGNVRIPLVVRLSPDGEATAQLTDGSMPYALLPQALSLGRGRIKAGKDQKETISTFITNALGIAGRMPADTNDRLVFARSNSFRKFGWDWMQDKHVTPDRLLTPGQNPEDLDAERLTPSHCPGLRLLRLRDRASTQEVPLGFGSDGINAKGRASGLYQVSDRIFYSINPRSDQMQTPLAVTKLDPDLHTNLRHQVSSPSPLEIFAAFIQPGDNVTALAAFTHYLRRVHLHTEQATQFPSVMHLCKLAEEYL